MTGIVRVVAGGSLTFALCGSTPAFAQAASTPAPAPASARGSTQASAAPAARSAAGTPAAPSSAERDRGGDAGGLDPITLAAPIRLTLEASVTPKASMFPNCVSREDAAGNSVGGIPVRHEVGFHLVPHLTLSLFTQLGCPIDAGIGGALSYSLPLRASTWLVFSGGAYTAPAQTQLFGGVSQAILRGLQGAPSSVAASARTDVVWQTHSGRPLHVGVESKGTTEQGLRVGAGF